MKIQEVEIFSDTPNAAILRLPSRKFPGVLIQGDTVFNMLSLSNEALELAKDSTHDDSLLEPLSELRRILEAYLSGYEQTLHAHGLPLPYQREVSARGKE